VNFDFVQSACPLTPAHGSSKIVKTGEAFGAPPYDRHVFEIYQCDRCGLGLTRPLPSPENAGDLYSERTSNDFQPGDADTVNAIKQYFARHDAAKFAKYSQKLNTILDYGCGNGAFTIALKEQFPNAQVYGTDYHHSPPSGMSAENYVAYADLGNFANRFDLVLARHVLEHTYDPTAFLRSLRELLTPEGILVIEVPSLDTPLRRLFGKYWDGYYVPYHPLHFTRESLALAIESAGLRVVGHGKAEMPKMGRTLRNIFQCPYNPLLFAAGVALQPVQVGVGLATNTAVCLRIWARK
jgi:SAM-dependent methyltransferase